MLLLLDDSLIGEVALQLYEMWCVEELRSVAACCTQIRGSVALRGVRLLPQTRQRVERLQAFLRKARITYAEMWSPQTTGLGWSAKWLDEADMQILGSLTAFGALSCLEVLWLQTNKIGDQGLAALAAAVGRGALPRLSQLGLSKNNIGDPGLNALASALGRSSLPALRDLRLYQNQIGNDGLVALASALDRGALPCIKTISTYGNPGSRLPLDNALAARGVQPP